MDFAGLGAHCQVSSCGQKDFLPFKCDACGLTTCLEHRTYRAHECQGTGKRRNVQVVLCPLCNKAFQIYEGDDADPLVDEHIRMKGCAREKKKKKAKKQRKPNQCHVPKCKKAELQPLRCKECNRLVCLKHRFPTDHACVARKQMEQARIASAKEAERRQQQQEQRKAPKKKPQVRAARGGNLARDSAAARQRGPGGGSGQAGGGHINGKGKKKDDKCTIS